MSSEPVRLIGKFYLKLSDFLPSKFFLGLYFAWTNCTENHPPLYPAVAAWAETVYGFRENLYRARLARILPDENNKWRPDDRPVYVFFDAKCPVPTGRT
jgi:hypothetical protein